MDFFPNSYVLFFEEIGYTQSKNDDSLINPFYKDNGFFICSRVYVDGPPYFHFVLSLIIEKNTYTLGQLEFFQTRKKLLLPSNGKSSLNKEALKRLASEVEEIKAAANLAKEAIIINNESKIGNIEVSYEKRFQFLCECNHLLVRIDSDDCGIIYAENPDNLQSVENFDLQKEITGHLGLMWNRKQSR